MKKAALQASNDAIRNDVDLIDPDELCDNLDLDLENSYADIRNEASTAPIWTTPSNATALPYGFQIVKQGRYVLLTGWFRAGAIGGVNNPSWPENQPWFRFNTTVSGNPSDILPSDANDSFTGVPKIFPFTAKTPLGTEVMMGVGYVGSYFQLFSKQTIPPNTTSTSRYEFSILIPTKE